MKAYFVVPKNSNMVPGTEHVRGAYRDVKTLYFLRTVHSLNTHSCFMFTPHRFVCVWVTLTIPPLFPTPHAFTQHTLLHHVHPTQVCVCGLHLLSHPYFLRPLHSPNTHSYIMFTPHRVVCVGYANYYTLISYTSCIHPTHTPTSYSTL